jgi:polysaccharide biosynthesis protein PslG
MRYRLLLALMVLLLVMNPASAQDTPAEEPVATDETIPTEESQPTEEVTPDSTTLPNPEPTEEVIIYVVQRGDTLAKIASRFGTTVNAIATLNGITNINLIYTGQQLKIPAANVTPTATVQTPPTTAITATPRPATLQPTPTAVTGVNTYIVQSGDTLFKIAVRFNTTVANLMALNNLSNPNLIYTGQTLIVSGEGGATPVPVTPTATITPAVTTEAATPQTSVELASFDYGITAFIADNNVNDLVTAIGELGVSWVRVDIRWSDLESTQGQIDFEALDTVIDALDGSEKNILLTITAAPDWARSSLDEDGPPDDFATFTTFVTALASRYTGRVDAYQIWNEPNLRREWNSDRYEIRADHYVDLLRGAYNGIKSVDPAALVIAAGLAPTGFNDGINAIDDRVYLQDMYSNGVLTASDAVAAHPGGWSNPPDAVCCQQPAGVETHYESPTFYFKDTLEDYHEIMVRNNDDRPLWVTKFGWGTSEDTSAPGADYVYITYTDLAEQAVYTPRAFEIGDELGYIGPMFLYNLNGCAVEPFRAERCFTSLIAPDGSLRPVFTAVAALEK